MEGNNKEENKETIPLKQKIFVYLEEIKVVLPGTQALLGFQLIAAFSYGFDKIPLFFKYVHIISLLLVCSSGIFLMTPAAFHRIAEHSQDTHRLHLLMKRMIIFAMAALGLGLATDLFVVVSIILQSVFIGVFVALIMSLFCAFTWFFYPYVKRMQKRSE